MSNSVLVEGHSINSTATLPRDDSYLAAKLPYARTEQIGNIRVKFLKGRAS